MGTTLIDGIAVCSCVTGNASTRSSAERGDAVGERPAPETLAPGGEARRAVLTRVHPGQREACRPRARASPAPRAAASASRRGRRSTASMIPRLIERKAGLGTSITALSEISTVTPEKSTALPAVSIVCADRLGGRQPRAEERAAEAMDDEERVVDPEREREHQREVHRPDRDRQHLGAEVERAGGRDQADHRQHQRQARRPRASRRRRSRIASVTGQEITSDLSIALLLASLKSDHIPEAPVRCTWTPPRPSPASGPLS